MIGQQRKACDLVTSCGLWWLMALVRLPGYLKYERAISLVDY